MLIIPLPARGKRRGLPLFVGPSLASFGARAYVGGVGLGPDEARDIAAYLYTLG